MEGNNGELGELRFGVNAKDSISGAPAENKKTKADMGKEGLQKTGAVKPESMSSDEKTRLISGSRSFNELYTNLKKVGDVVDRDGRSFDANHLIQMIEDVHSGRALLEAVTKTHDLQKLVKELLDKEKAAITKENPVKAEEAERVNGSLGQVVPYKENLPTELETLEGELVEDEGVVAEKRARSEAKRANIEEKTNKDIEEQVANMSKEVADDGVMSIEDIKKMSAKVDQEGVAAEEEKLSSAWEHHIADTELAADLKENTKGLATKEVGVNQDDPDAVLAAKLKENTKDLAARSESDLEETPKLTAEGEETGVESSEPQNTQEQVAVEPEQAETVEEETAEANPERPTEEAEQSPEQGPVNKEYEATKKEWLSSRQMIKEIDKEYAEVYKTHLDKAGKIGSLINVSRKLFGLDPTTSPEMEALKHVSRYHRKQQLKAAEKMMNLKTVEPGKTYGDISEVTKRYQRMLGYHLTTAAGERRLAMEEKLIEEKYPSLTTIRETMKSINEHKVARIGVMALGYGAIAGMTGGVGVGVVAGGLYVPRALAGMFAGGVAGTATKKGLDRTWVQGARKNLEKVQKDTSENIFAKNFYDLDDKVDKAAKSVRGRSAKSSFLANLVGMGVGMEAAAHVGGGIDGVVDQPVSSSQTETGANNEVQATQQPAQASVNGAAESPASEADPDTAPAAETANESDQAENPHLENKPDRVIDTSRATETPGVEGERVLPADQAAENAPAATTTETTPSTVPTPTAKPSIATAGETTVAESQAGPKSDRLSGAVEKNIDRVPQSEADTTVSETINDSTPVPEAKPETIANAGFHTVEKGQDLWNILEGNGPDSNPVGGESEVLKGMSMTDRQAALNKLVDYMRSNPDFSKSVGVSSGDPYKIFYASGERVADQLNIPAIDEKIRELIGNNDVSTNLDQSVAELRSDINQLENDVQTFDIKDVNELTVQDVLDLQERVNNNDSVALSRIEQLGLDKAGLADVTESLNKYGSADLAGEMTVRDFLDSTPRPTESNVDVGTDTPSSIPETNNAEVREASLVTPEADPQAVANYVAEVEKPGGILSRLTGEQNVAGTYEALKNTPLGQMNEMMTKNEFPEGVTRDGVDRWLETLGETIKQVPASNEETLGEYISKVANTRTA